MFVQALAVGLGAGRHHQTVDNARFETSPELATILSELKVSTVTSWPRLFFAVH